MTRKEFKMTEKMEQENSTERSAETQNETRMILDSTSEFSDLFTTQCFSHRIKIQCCYGNFQELRQDGTFCDVTLLLGPEKVPMKAHKVVLAGFSDYFKTLFTSSFCESNQPEIELPAIHPEHMELILDLVYRQKSDLKPQDLYVLATMADFLGCEGLKEQCATILCQNFESLKGKMFEMIQFAKKYGFQTVTREAKKFIGIHFKEICTSMDSSTTNLESFLCLLEVAGGPKVVQGKDSFTEKGLFLLLWKAVKRLPQETQTALIPRILKAVHLPCMCLKDLEVIEKKVQHIPDAKELMEKAKEKHGPCFITSLTDPVDLWCVPRVRARSYSFLIVVHAEKLREINTAFSEVVLLDGVPLCVAATTSHRLSDSSMQIRVHCFSSEFHRLQCVLKVSAVFESAVLASLFLGAGRNSCTFSIAKFLEGGSMFDSVIKRGCLHIRVELKVESF